MTVALGILTFVVALAILILAHEIGHFASAKLMGVRVEEFGLGFPPRIKVWRRNGTLYSLNAIPVGGFVKMLGENGDRPEPDSFGAKAPWKRLLILAAGPAMNILFALLIFFVVFMIGSPRGLTTVTKVADHSPAALAGLRSGDRIVAVDGTSVQYSDELRLVTEKNLGRRVVVDVTRGARIIHVRLVPRKTPPRNQGAMGIQLGKTTTMSYGPAKSLELSVTQVKDFVTSLPAIFQNVAHHGSGNLVGPIGIARATTQTVQQEPQLGIGAVLYFIGFISVNLGILNLLPLPALDGGRIVFVLLSWVRRRNVDPELESLVHLMGMAVLLVLIALISYQDLAKLFKGSS